MALVDITTSFTDTGKHIAKIAVSDMALKGFNGVKETLLEIDTIKIVSLVIRGDDSFVLLITNVPSESPYLLHSQVEIEGIGTIAEISLDGQTFESEPTILENNKLMKQAFDSVVFGNVV